MKFLPALIVLLMMPAVCFGQETGNTESSDFKEVVHLAVLQPESKEFDSAWSDYVGKHIQSGTGVGKAIDRVIDGIKDYRKQIRVPGSSANTGPAMKTSTLRDKMQALADARLLDSQE